MPTSTVEDYLKSILMAEPSESGARVSTGRIATALEVAPATVTSMLKTLASSGLVDYEPYSGVSLTAAGRQLALHVLRRHRLVELFLVQVMGMDWSEVHADAEVLEHSVSERLIERMDEMLGRPEVDPHGDPIPTAGGEVQQPKDVSLVHGPVGEPLRVARVRDQNVDFLQLVEREGLMPGRQLVIEKRDEAAESVTIDRHGRGRLNLGFGAASKIMVSAVD